MFVEDSTELTIRILTHSRKSEEVLETVDTTDSLVYWDPNSLLSSKELGDRLNDS